MPSELLTKLTLLKQKGKKFFASKALCCWSVVNWCAGNQMRTIENFVQSLSRSLVENGMQVYQKTPPILQVRTRVCLRSRT